MYIIENEKEKKKKNKKKIKNKKISDIKLGYYIL